MSAQNSAVISGFPIYYSPFLKDLLHSLKICEIDVTLHFVILAWM